MAAEEGHGQCVCCSAAHSADEPGKAFPCCSATYCPSCAAETIENECCAECFRDIDKERPYDAAPAPPTPPETPTEPSAPSAPPRHVRAATTRALREERKRLETIQRRGERVAQNSDIRAVDLAAGGACPAPEDVRAVFERDENLAPPDVLHLLQDAHTALSREPNVVHLQAPLLTIGDIHGQFGDLIRLCHGDGDNGALLRARRACGAPDALARPPRIDDESGDDVDLAGPGGEDKVGSLLFLGDYVDRGARSCEVLFYLLALKVRYPRQVHLLRGNHESRNCTGHFGFRDECIRKYGPHVYHKCCQVFEAMPLGAIVTTARGGVFCCHGGLGPDLQRVSDLDAIDRFVEPKDSGLLCDILWADPRRDDDDAARRTTLASFDKNPTRGCSVVFGETAVDRFLARNQLLAMIRAHECQVAGLASDYDDTDMPFRSSGEFEHLDGEDRPRTWLARVTTVFSAADYCGTKGNLGAVLVVGWNGCSAVAYEACSDPRDFLVPAPAADGELTAAAVLDAQSKAPFMPTTIEGFADAARGLTARPGATPRKPRRRRSSGGARRRSVDALSPEAKFVSRRFAAASRNGAISELDPRVLGRLVAEGAVLNDSAVAAFATRAPFVDSGAGALAAEGRGKVVILRSRFGGNQADGELAALRADMRANRDGRENAPPAPATPALNKAKARYAAAMAPVTPLQRRGFADDELHALKTIFAMFDQDGEGQLSRPDLFAYAEAVGEYVSSQDVDAVFTCLGGGTEGSATIGLEEWVLFAAKMKASWDFDSAPATPVSPVAGRTRSRTPASRVCWVQLAVPNKQGASGHDTSP